MLIGLEANTENNPSAVISLNRAKETAVIQ